VYICIGGEFIIKWDGETTRVTKGETVLLPAMIKEVIIEPDGESQLLEIYINTDTIL